VNFFIWYATDDYEIHMKLLVLQQLML